MEFDSEHKAKIWVLKNQLNRRNISIFDRTTIALQIKEEIAKEAKERQRGGQDGVLLRANSPNPIESVNTREEVAKLAGVGSNTVSKVEKILNEASEEVKDT